MPNRFECWRCHKGRVRLLGLACTACLPILYAEYDAKRAANGGKLLFIPEDWDGPALPVSSEVLVCQDCGDEFTRRRASGYTELRCDDCKGREQVERSRRRRDRAHALGVNRRYNRPSEFPLDLEHV